MLLGETSSSANASCAATQAFQGPIQGDVAGRDVVHHHHSHGRPLTPQERSELNGKVKRLHEEFGSPGWQTWRTLHGYAGVDSIEAMRLDHRDSVNAILDLMLEVAALKAAAAKSDEPTDADRLHARELAALVEQNGELAARAEEASRRSSELQHLLGIAEGKVANAVEALRQMKRDNTALGRSISLARRRARLHAALSILIGAGAAGAAFAAYEQAQRAALVEQRLTVCEFEGKPYAIGSTLTGPPTRECKAGDDGVAIWSAVTVKSGRPR